MTDNDQNKPFRQQMEEWLESRASKEGNQGSLINPKLRHITENTYIISFVIIVLLIVIFGRGACTPISTYTPIPTYTPVPTNTSIPTRPNTATPQLSGSITGANQTAKQISLHAGAAVFHISGSSSLGGRPNNFLVELKDSQGNYIDMLANEIGTCDVSKITSIPYSGQYYLDVSCNGSWAISWN